MLNFSFDIAANAKNLNEAARVSLKRPLKKGENKNGIETVANYSQ